MRINRANLAILGMASKDETRHNLTGLQVTQNETVATNGHMLGWVTVLGDGPVPEGTVPEAPLKPCVIASESAKTLKQAIPKKDGYATVDVHGTNAGGEFLATIKNGDVVSPVAIKKVDADFPDWEQVVPKTKLVSMAAFDVKYLAEMCSAVKEMGGRAVVIEMHRNSEVEATVFRALLSDTGQVATFIIMPMRV